MKKSIIFFVVINLLLLLTSCGGEDSNTNNTKKDKPDGPLFELKSVADCGIDFNNKIIEDEVYNHILIDVVVNGGGVATVDINNDGLLDLFFAGNMVSDRLYLNKGNLQFEDITKSAGVENDSWSTTIAIADVNNDGWQDIFVGKFIIQDKEKRRNQLYINNGDNTFTEKAKEYGLDHDGHCTAANFFDYDQDGDLDLYIGIEPFVLRHTKYNKNYKYNPDDYPDILYRNDGGIFTDVTQAAGLKHFNFTLSATVADLNHDGWPDMYIASDYEEPDYYYINNGDGTFTNQVHSAMRHISNFSMGVDMADVNNDGWIDIVIADMAPEDNYRSKANMSGMNPEKFWSLAKNGYHYQYMFNTLQLNNGNGTFSEIGHMAGIAQTDWSWATLLGDYDLDGDKDLFIANGQLRDVRNKDYTKKVGHIIDSLSKVGNGVTNLVNSAELYQHAPQQKLRNYLFFNNNDLSFTNQASEAGLVDKTFTQGAAYADLDNDGDLDLVMNNMNDRAFLYENHATEQTDNHYLSIRLKGENTANSYVYGAKVWLINNGKVQLQEVSPTRGYMSSSDPVLLFGLGENQKVDRLVVQWPGGKVTELKNIDADQRLELNQSEGEVKPANIYHINPPLFANVIQQAAIDYVHIENKFDDYKDEVLIPHRMSTLGPASAKADVNGDGLEDLFLGGAAGFSAGLFIQQEDNSFKKAAKQPWIADKASEDIHALFFDADQDGDQDLYITSGGNEFPLGSPKLQDRLYINQGNGQFAKSSKIPVIRTSGGVAAAGDLDGDGDLDLFIGGRQVPGKYGHPAQSYILRNDNGQFEDISDQFNINLEKMGMVSDAKWADIDGDKDLDLVIAGEWMPITVYTNNNGKLHNNTALSGLDNTNGWWNRLVLADMDKDGDLDIIAGNLGLNIKFKASQEKPFVAYIKDFDENGTNDTYLAYYDASGHIFPVRGRQCSSEQLPYIIEEFENYDKFAKATVEEVLGDRIEGAIKHEAVQFKSLYLENDGKGVFSQHTLPSIAQSFPVFGIIPKDLNNDGVLDLILAGNYYEREVETTRSDAGIGLILLGDGKGGFKPMPAYETGIAAYLDVRNILLLNNKSKPLLVVVNNNEGVQVYQ